MNEKPTEQPKKKRPWFQIHLSTAIVLMVVSASAIFGINWYWKRHFLGITLELERIEWANPKQDAEDSIAKSDFRFIGIDMNGIVAPGVDIAVSKQYGIRTIEGTTDCVSNTELLRLQDIAIKYAESYNAILLKKLLPMQH